MPAPRITPMAMFSLRTDVKQNAHYISDFQILYPAGSVLILHNYYEKRQKYIKLFEKSCFLEMIAISPSRKLAAIIQNGEKGQIMVFDMVTLKRRRTLNLPHDSITNRFETLAFSHDEVYIMAITGEPDWLLVTYKWEKGKVASTTKAIYPGHPGKVFQICCSPTNSTEVCLYGQNLFRLLTMTESVWRQYGFQKADQITVTSATYLSGDKVICGTSDGKIFFVDNGDLRSVFNALTATVISVKDKEEASLSGSSSLLVVKAASTLNQWEDVAVRALFSFPKGFAYSCRVGYVHFFEKESNTRFRKRNLFKICDTDLGDLQESELNTIQHLSINVSQDKLLATTNRAQIYTVRLWGPDINVAPEIPFKHLGEPLHHGAIIDLSMCLWKPIFATVGAVDKTIRVWNYETESVEIVKQLTESVICIDLHPTGNLVAIAYPNRIDISSVLVNDIQTFVSLPVQNCRRCRFSEQGCYLAAVNKSNEIEVHGVILLNYIYTLKGHTGRVHGLMWILSDKKIISCGFGEILFWDALNGTMLGEFQYPGINFMNIAVSSDGKFVYAVGSDGHLREICDYNIVKSIKLAQHNLSGIVLSRSNHMVFLTGNNTDVMSVKMPLTIPPEYAVFHYHSTNVCQINLSYDDQSLVTVSKGGAIIIWKVTSADGKNIEVDKNVFHSNEVLINKAELEKKLHTIKDLSQKLYELELDQARDMRDAENSFSEKIKEIHESHTTAIKELKEKIEQTEMDQNNQLQVVKKQLDDLRTQQKKEKVDLIENYKSKLVVEYEKVRALDDLKEQTISVFESKVAELERSTEEETSKIIEFYNMRLAEVNDLMKQTVEENKKNIEEHEKIKQYIEDDADREIVETKAKYEVVLKEEKEHYMVLKEETIVMTKKFSEAQKERDDFRERAKALQGEHQKYQASIQTLEKDIVDLKNEIMERDTALDDKDERIVLLKKKIVELDKFKFVLDYKVKELKKQIEPKDREIKEKKDQIDDMVVELDNLRKLNSSLELQLVELKEKILGTERDIVSFEKRHQNASNALRQIKVDIYSLHRELNNYKNLKEGIKVLYHKYNGEDVGLKETPAESDLQRELMMQREFLENTIIALKSTLQKNQTNRKDGTKVIRDNALLLEELNRVRRDLKRSNLKVRKMMNLIGVKSDRPVVSSEAYNGLQQKLKKHENIKQLYQEVINETNEETANLHCKVEELQQKLRDLLKSEKMESSLEKIPNLRLFSSGSGPLK